MGFFEEPQGNDYPFDELRNVSWTKVEEFLKKNLKKEEFNQLKRGGAFISEFIEFNRDMKNENLIYIFVELPPPLGKSILNGGTPGEKKTFACLIKDIVDTPPPRPIMSAKPVEEDRGLNLERRNRRNSDEYSSRYRFTYDTIETSRRARQLIGHMILILATLTAPVVVHEMGGITHVVDTVSSTVKKQKDDLINGVKFLLRGGF